MSLSRLLRSTRLLIEQALFEMRDSQRGGGLIRVAQLRQLEERLLMSATPVAVVQPVDAGAPPAAEPAELSSAAFEQLLNAPFAAPEAEAGSTFDTNELVSASTEDPADSSLSTEIVIVDASAVNDALTAASSSSLMSGEYPATDSRITRLDPTRDGIAQITLAILNSPDAESLRVVATSEAGGIRLGSTLLTQESLTRYEGVFSGWKYALADHATITLDLSSTAASLQPVSGELIDQLRDITGLDIRVVSPAGGETNDLAVTPVAEELSNAPIASVVVPPSEPSEPAQLRDQAPLLDPSSPRASSNASFSAGTTVVFVDAGIADYQSFIDDITARDPDGVEYLDRKSVV